MRMILSEVEFYGTQKNQRLSRWFVTSINLLLHG